MTDLLIRADAGSRIGTGHVMRCLALGLEWRKRAGRVSFLSHCESLPVRHRVESNELGFIPQDRLHPDPQDLSRTLSVLETLRDPWLVLDGYGFDPGYQQAVRDAGYGLLVIDDIAHHDYYSADVLLNQNIGAEKLLYNCPPETIRLMGATHALLRPEFLALRGRKPPVPEVASKVLVTMGGADPCKVTLRVLEALLQIDGIEATVVIGPDNPHGKELEHAATGWQDKAPGSSIRLVKDAVNMPDLMAWAEVAVSAAGSTCWELAFLGVPSLLLILAKNQSGIAAGLHDEGAAINLGWFDGVTAEELADKLRQVLNCSGLRRSLSMNARALVDGRGPQRVVNALEHQTAGRPGGFQ